MKRFSFSVFAVCMALLSGALVAKVNNGSTRRNGVRQENNATNQDSHKKLAVYQSELDTIKEYIAKSKMLPSYISELKSKIAANQELESVSKYAPDYISPIPALREVLKYAEKAKSLENLEEEMTRAINDLKVYKIAQ